MAPLEPVVRSLVLLALIEALLEQAAVIGDADTVCRKAEGCKGVDETCGKTSKAAVTKARLILELLEFGDVTACSCKLCLHVVIDAKIDQVVGEELADEELGGDVVQLLLSLVVTDFLCLVGGEV